MYIYIYEYIAQFYEVLIVSRAVFKVCARAGLYDNWSFVKKCFKDKKKVGLRYKFFFVSVNK